MVGPPIRRLYRRRSRSARRRSLPHRKQFPDGKILWITGQFETIERPGKLVYTWSLEPETDVSERVTITFESRGAATEVIVTHERIPNTALRDMHEQGWQGCLDGLAKYLGDDGLASR